MVADYLYYLLKSKGINAVHAPFVIDLIVNVLNRRADTSELEVIDKYRVFLKKNALQLDIEDFGSGSHKIKSNIRSVSQIYKTASSNARMGEILYQLAKYYKCKNSIEIGTCLGVGTAYLSAAPLNRLTTIEGSATLLRFTKEHFNQHFFNNQVNFVEGNFDTVLPEVLSAYESIDFAFVDGNHKYASTMKYFEQLLKKVHRDSILIFDDIYWSEGMKKAWEEICNHEDVSCSIDIFRWGIVFFNKEMQKEKFTLRFDNFLQAHIL